MSLIKKILRWNNEFVTFFFRPLSPDNLHFVDSLISGDIISLADGNEVMISINTKDLTKLMIKQFASGARIENETIQVLIELFRARDQRKCVTYLEVNEGSNVIAEYGPRKPSLYFSFEKYREIVQFPDDASFDLPEGQPIDAYYQVYMLHMDEVSGNCGVIILFLDTKKMYYISPNLRLETPVTQPVNALLSSILDSFKAASASLGIDLNDWDISMYPHQHSDILDGHSPDSIIWIFGMLYFLQMDCFIYFNKRIGEITRKNLCHWVLTGSLPL